MLLDFARKLKSRTLARLGVSAGLTSLLLLTGAGSVHDAAALNETRTLSFHHTHSGEDLTVTFKRNGRYDEDALKELNHYLRDWRSQDQIVMDRHLFDILWEVYRDVDGTKPIQIISAYRSPGTNAMLRNRSSHTGVARFSQHMLGHAMDFFIPGVALEQIRFAGLRLQRGGVGFYPTSGSPFVHLDTGNIRHWPRMTHDQLARVFPDGRTVHVPSDGHPLAGYQLAMAEIEKRGGDGDDSALARSKPSLFTSLFKGRAPASDDDDEGADSKPADVKASSGKPSAISLMAAAMPEKSSDPIPLPRAKPAKVMASYQIASADMQTLPAKTLEKTPDKTAEKPNTNPEAQYLGVPAPRPPGSIPNAGEAATTKFETPADIINARGFWGDTPATPKQAAPALVAAITARQALAAAADPQANARPSAFQQALAYAPATSSQIERMPVVTASAPMPRSARPASAVRNAMALNAVTTVIAKGGPQGQTAAVSTSARLSAAPTRDDDVWMRMMILAPSATTAMSATVMGDSDMTVLRTQFVKPQVTLAMSFSDDPQQGLLSDQFTGPAIASIAIMPFTRTASLK